MEDALCRAIHINDISNVQLLLDQNEFDRGCINNTYATAAYLGYTGIVKLLLDRGADIESCDKHGVSALIWAVRCRNLETVKLLLDRGVNIEYASADVYDLALELQHYSIARLIFLEKLERNKDRVGGSTKSAAKR